MAQIWTRGLTHIAATAACIVVWVAVAGREAHAAALAPRQLMSGAGTGSDGAERQHPFRLTAANASAAGTNASAGTSATGSPSNGEGAGTREEGSSPERRAEMAALLDKYAPVFKLASDELYYPSSVKFMLDRYAYIASDDGAIYRPPPNDRHILSQEHLGELRNNGIGQALSVDEDHNGQPQMPREGEFLYGPAGQDGALEIGPDGRGRVHDEVYGFWVDQGRGVVDLWYWTFYPYNLGKLVGTLGYLGNHVTDWERLRLRTVNGKAVSADFNTHSGGPFSAGTYRWEEVERTPDDRPIAYIATGSHGVWPTPGRHVYAQLLNLWALVDQADDEGALWDTKGHVVPIEYWTGPDEARVIKHDGDQSWLEFRGAWGNFEPNTCWWHTFVGICQVISGPPGPNRDFGYPPDCIIGETDGNADENSESHFEFFFSRATAAQAQAIGITHVVVEQVCARPSSSFASLDDPSLSERDLELWVTSTRVPFIGVGGYAATSPACAGSRSAAKAYRLSVYDGKKRVSTSPLRTLCIYVPGQRGWANAPVADVRDLDEWRWDLRTKDDGERLVPPKRAVRF